MIVDAHAHLGWDQVFDHDFREDALLESQERNGIDVTLVQPATAHDLPTVQRYHDAIADLARRFPGHFFGIANPNPHLAGDAYETEVRRCVQELGFVGIKLHPMAHAVNPAGHAGRRVFALAQDLGVPVIVHTGSGIPWSAPALIDPAASERPGLKIVLAHAGAMILAGEAGQLAARRPNVYLECTWSASHTVQEWCRRFGPQRLLFGSDHAENAPVELAKFRSIGFSDEELGWMLGGTAASVFGLRG